MKIVNLKKNLDEVKDDVKEINKKISEIIIDRDHVITIFTKMVNSELSSGYF